MRQRAKDKDGTVKDRSTKRHVTSTKRHVANVKDTAIDTEQHLRQATDTARHPRQAESIKQSTWHHSDARSDAMHIAERRTLLAFVVTLGLLGAVWKYTDGFGGLAREEHKKERYGRKQLEQRGQQSV